MAIFELWLAVRNARALAEGASEGAAMAGRTTERRGTAPGRLVGRRQGIENLTTGGSAALESLLIGRRFVRVGSQAKPGDR